MSANESYYHVYTKSISGFRIFRNRGNCHRIIRAAQFYQFESLPMSYADFLGMDPVRRDGFLCAMTNMARERQWKRRVDLLGYCVMSTHIHLIVQEVRLGSLSDYMSDVLNSYTRYFNLRYGRKGPLWQGRFGRRSVVGIEDLLNTSAYVYLNPVVEFMVEDPHDWEYSAFREISTVPQGQRFLDIIGMDFEQYRLFVRGQIQNRRDDAALKRCRK